MKLYGIRLDYKYLSFSNDGVSVSRKLYRKEPTQEEIEEYKNQIIKLSAELYNGFYKIDIECPIKTSIIDFDLDDE